MIGSLAVRAWRTWRGNMAAAVDEQLGQHWSERMEAVIVGWGSC